MKYLLMLFILYSCTNTPLELECTTPLIRVSSFTLVNRQWVDTTKPSWKESMEYKYLIITENHVDPCQKYRDSIFLCQKNIEINKKQYHLGITPTEKKKIDATINKLNTKITNLKLKIKKCK